MATADAAVNEGAPAGVPQHACRTRATITNVKAVPNVIRYPSGPNWRVSGRGPGQLTLSKSVAVANSVSGTVTGAHDVKAATISAAVGFSVTRTYTTATSFSVTIPSGVTEELRAGAVYGAKTFNWRTVEACDTGYHKAKTGTGEAFRFLRLQYSAKRI